MDSNKSLNVVGHHLGGLFHLGPVLRGSHFPFERHAPTRSVRAEQQKLLMMYPNRNLQCPIKSIETQTSEATTCHHYIPQPKQQTLMHPAKTDTGPFYSTRRVVVRGYVIYVSRGVQIASTKPQTSFGQYRLHQTPKSWLDLTNQ